MNQSEAAALVKKHGNKEAAARASGVSARTIGRALGGKAMAVPVSAATVSLADIIRPHDMVGKAVAAVAGVPAGRLMTDEALRREVGVGDGRWRSVRGSARLSGHWYAMPDKSLVWGNKATITALSAKMKEIV